MTLKEIEDNIHIATYPAPEQCTRVVAQLTFSAIATVDNRAMAQCKGDLLEEVKCNLKREIIYDLFLDQRKTFRKLAMDLLQCDPYTNTFRDRLEALVTQATHYSPL